MSTVEHRSVHERLVSWAEAAEPTPSPELIEVMGEPPLRETAAAGSRVVPLRPAARAGIGVKVLAVVLGLGVASAAAVGVTRAALGSPDVPDPVVVPSGHPAPAPSDARRQSTEGSTASTAPPLVPRSSATQERAPGPERSSGPAPAKPRTTSGARSADDPAPTATRASPAPAPATDDGSGTGPSTDATAPSSEDPTPDPASSEPTADASAGG